jgi:TRAP-type C4-dicarboxylate transport system permease small subunit
VHPSFTMSPPSSFSGRLFAFERAVFAVEKAVCIAALTVMLFAISMSVLVRYLNLPIPNFAEWGVVAMAPLAFVGLAMCTYTGTHIAVDLVNSLESPLLRRIGRFCTGTAAIVFAAVYFTSSWIFFRETLQSGEKMMDMGTPLGVPLVFLPVGLVLVLFHSALEVWRTLADIAPIAPEENLP